MSFLPINSFWFPRNLISVVYLPALILSDILEKFGQIQCFLPPPRLSQTTDPSPKLLIFFSAKLFQLKTMRQRRRCWFFSLLYCTFQMGNSQSQNSKHIPQHFLANTLHCLYTKMPLKKVFTPPFSAPCFEFFLLQPLVVRISVIICFWCGPPRPTFG